MLYASAVYQAYSRQSFLVRLTNQFDAFFNPKAPQRRNLQINNKCSKQMLITVVSRNSCPAASVTMFHRTYINCRYCCVTCVSFFNLRHPRDFTLAHVPKACIYDTHIHIRSICRTRQYFRRGAAPIITTKTPT